MAGLTCKWCSKTLVPVGEKFGCRVCDTAPATNPGNRLRGAPPNMKGAKAGWIMPVE